MFELSTMRVDCTVLKGIYHKLTYNPSGKEVLFIPHHTLVAGYYVFTLAIRVSVRLSVRPSGLCFRSITLVFIKGFHSNFAHALVPTMSSLGLLMGKFR